MVDKIRDAALSRLPKTAAAGMSKIFQTMDDLRKPFKQKRTVVHPLTLQALEQEIEVQPNVNLVVQMPAAKVVRIYAHRIKPMTKPTLVQEFVEADFDALRSQVEAAGVSWEEYFAQVMNGR